MTSLIVRDDLIVTTDGIKVFRIDGCHLLVYDKDKRRCHQRGCDHVSIPIEDLLEILQCFCKNIGD